MTPAECWICGTPAVESKSPNQGDWVEFADYRPLPGPAPLGHPAGLAYFCEDHLPAARALASQTESRAMDALRAQFGDRPFAQPVARIKWWQRLFG